MPVFFFKVTAMVITYSLITGCTGQKLYTHAHLEVKGKCMGWKAMGVSYSHVCAYSYSSPVFCHMLLLLKCSFRSSYYGGPHPSNDQKILA